MRRALAIPVLLLAALLVWRARGGGRGAPPVPEPSGVAGTRPSPEALADVREDHTSTGTSQRSPVADMVRFEPLPPDPTGLALRFVTGKPETRLVDVEAFALPTVEYAIYQEPFADVEAELRAHGTRLPCDAEGLVHLPLPERSWLVGARAPGLYGAGTFDADDGPDCELELVPSSDCLVYTRDQAGRAGPDGAIAVTTRDGPIWRGVTGTDGTLRIPNLGSLLADLSEYRRTFHVTTIDAAPVARRFDLAQGCPREVALVLPAACALHVSVLASDGTPVSVNGELAWFVADRDSSREAPSARELALGSLPIRAGVARLGRAAPGSWLWLYAQFDGGQEVSAEVRVPDELESEIELRLESEQQALLFAALDGSGAPLASRMLGWFTWREPEDPEDGPDTDAVPVRLDAAGRCALVVPREDPPRGWHGVLRSHGLDAALVGPTIDEERLERAPVLDLGTVRLVRARPLVEGFVHDPTGAPIARARLGLRTLPGNRSLDGTDGLTTGADGRFEVFASCLDRGLRVEAARDGYLPLEESAVQELDCGGPGSVDLTLVRAGAMRMSILVDQELGEDLEWRILRGGEEVESEVLRAGKGPGEITCEEEELRPGFYDMQLVTRDPLAAPLVDLAGIEVRSGELTIDPRLQRVPVEVTVPFQPREFTPESRIVLRIVDEAGRPVPSGVVTTWGWDSILNSPFDSGSFEVESWQVGRKLGVWGAGRRCVEIQCPEHDLEIALAPALPLRVRLDPPAAFRLEHVRMLARLANERLEFALDDAPLAVEIDARGEALFECPAPGEYRLELEVVHLDGSGRVEASAELDRAEVDACELPDVPGEQFWEPVIRAAVWERLAGELGLAR